MFPKHGTRVVQFLADVTIAFRGKRGVAAGVRAHADQSSPGHDADLLPCEESARVYRGHLIARLQMIEQEKTGAQRHPLHFIRPILLLGMQMAVVAIAHAPVTQVHEQRFQPGMRFALRPEPRKALLNPAGEPPDNPAAGTEAAIQTRAH